MGATLMLAKHDWTPKRLNFPVSVYEKLDGSAADFYSPEGREVLARTRQDKPILSVGHICEFLWGYLEPKQHLIGELYIEGEQFKTIGGLARKQETQPQLTLRVYDFYTEDVQQTYKERMTQCAEQLLQHLCNTDPVQIIPALGTYDNLEGLEAYITEFLEMNPDKEGVVVRSHEGPDSYYNAGKRSYGMMARKHKSSEDLVVHSFEEAIDKKTGKGLGMVGRINLHYNGEIIGAGPGKLTHDQRKLIWHDPEEYTGRVAEITYKPDAGYDALREARFYRWRFDKE